jgi:hypothetical protein
LLLLWEIGIPVLTSPTPAYTKVMTTAQVDGMCKSDEQWIEKIRAFKNMTDQQREEMAMRGKDYLNKTHTKEIILCNWDKIFESVLDDNRTQSNRANLL